MKARPRLTGRRMRGLALLFTLIALAVLLAGALSLIRALEANGVRPVVDRRFPLADLAEAFRHEEGASHFGKIGIEW